jgi:hypothetical protein
MKTYTFKVVVEPDEDALGNPAWHAYCPAPGCRPDEPSESRLAARIGRPRGDKRLR